MSFMSDEKEFGLPLVVTYFEMRDNVFLNTAHAESEGVEAVGNTCLAPYHYLYGGRKFVRIDSEMAAQSIFPEADKPVFEILKTVAAIIALPIALLIGSFLKAISLLTEPGKKHYEMISTYCKTDRIEPRAIELPPVTRVPEQDRVPRPTAELTDEVRERIAPLLDGLSEIHQKEIAALPQTMQKDLIALKDTVQLLDKYGIPNWIDCGSLLGLVRHEGAIPWDHDIDIAVRKEDHEDIMKITRDPEFAKKYYVMDWSPADQPGSFIKLYVKSTGSLIDFYHYEEQTNPQTGEKSLVYLSPYYNKWYLPEPLKIREEACLKAKPYEQFFPLQRALFDGVEVGIPAKAIDHLKGIYGERLDPAKVWDESKKAYVNVPGHPYWDKSDI